MKENSFVYVITNKSNTTLYIGVTSDLPKRIYEHRAKCVEGFSKKYNLYKLVYYEACPDIESAIVREKQLKKWNRQWKIDLIKKMNPGFEDLYNSIC